MESQTLPVHIAIIPDGNRRWAKSKGLPSLFGHKKGFDRTDQIIFYANELGIKALTFYAFSTENWNRAKDEVDYLINLFVKGFERYISKFKANNIKFRHLGDINGIPADCAEKILEGEKNTAENTGMIVQLAINYGGRDELRRAIVKILENGKKPEDITDGLISHYLDTSDVPDPDLVIRTSGEERLSNFLPWQTVYAELYFCKKLWPDFNKRELDKAIAEFSQRQRRFGK